MRLVRKPELLPADTQFTDAELIHYLREESSTERWENIMQQAADRLEALTQAEVR